MRRSILVELCAVMLLFMGAPFAGHVLGHAFSAYLSANTDRVQEQGRRELEEFRRQRDAELRAASERNPAMVDAIVRASQPAAEAYRAEVARIRAGR